MPPSGNRRLALYRGLALAALGLSVLACVAALIYGASGAIAQRSIPGGGAPTVDAANAASDEKASANPSKPKRTFTPKELGFAGPASLLKWSARAHPKHVRNALRQVDDLLGIPKSTLASIASCESGGNADSVSSDGTYRGRYQFDLGAWQSVGGRGDPAKAPGWEQDVRAAILIDARGTSPWPNCG
jgi:hypothetical protein